MKNLSKIFVGVDISKAFLDIHLHPIGKSLKIENSKSAVKKLLQQLLRSYQIQQVVCESSGGYEFFLTRTFRGAGYNVWQVDPKRIKAFIKSEGIKAKTDKIDAQMIALFAAQKTRTFAPRVITEQEEKLKALFKRRTDLTKNIGIEKNRLEKFQQVYCREYIKKHIRFLEKQLKKINTEIEKMLEEDVEWKKKTEILESVPGVGKTTSAALLSHVPELGNVGEKEICALLGVAPYTRESGTYKGRAVTSSGRMVPRRVLYMAALTATTYNPKLKAFYEKLRKAGKNPKVAIVAVMRRLLIILNALIRKEEKWSSNFA